MGLGTYLSDNLFGDERKKRQEEAPQYAQRLMLMGITDPNLINKSTQDYIETGQVNLPTTETTRREITPGMDVQNPNGGVPTSILPTTEEETKPIRLGAKHVLFNKDSGEYSAPEELQGAATVTPYSPKPPVQAKVHFIDAQSGKDIRVEPTTGDEDKFITVGSRSDTQNDPATKYHLGVLDDYRTALNKNEMTDELQNAAANSAQALGLPVSWQTDIQEPGFWSKLFGGKPTETQTPKIGYPPNQGSKKTQSPASNKKLSVDQAKEFLRRAGNDKNKARQMARTEGYSF